MIAYPAKLWIMDGDTKLEGAWRGLRLFLVLNGEIGIYYERGSRRLGNGGYIAAPDGEYFRISASEESLYGMLEFDMEIAGDYLDLEENRVRADSDEDPEEVRETLRALLRRCFSYYEELDGVNAPAAAAAQYELLHELRVHCLIPKKKTIIEKKLDERAVRAQILSYLHLHYAEQISLKDLAEVTWFSESYLSRYISKRFDRTYSGLLADIRLDHAVERVENSDDKMIRIALESGFPNVAAFNREFRRRYGRTPSEYREAHGRREHLLQSEDGERDKPIDRKIHAYMDAQAEILRESKPYEQTLAVTEGGERRQLKRFWNRMINAGPARSLLRADMQEHLTELHRNLGFQYIRFWDILGPELMIYDGDPLHGYSFGRIDAVLSYLFSHDMYPYLEIGFKPVQLMGELASPLMFEERHSPFPGWKEYCVFIGEFLRHCRQLFGDDYVGNWVLELWFDPRRHKEENYLNLFEEIAEKAKQAFPRIRIGGAGFSREYGNRLETLLRAWGKRQCRPDFISVYLYPFDNGFLDALPGDHPEKTTTVYRGDDYNSRFIQKIQRIAEENGLGHTELHLTEWNSTIVNRDPLNDSIYKGAYIVRALMQMVGRVDLAGYWVASDLYSDYYDSSHLLDGSCGLLSKNGICKPAYYGLEFFNRLGNFVLASDENGIITSDGSGRYRIVCHNYVHPAAAYFDHYDKQMDEAAKGQEYELFRGEKRSLHYIIYHVPNGRYTVKTRLLDAGHGSVDDEWRRMERTDALDMRDIEYLRRISVPQISIAQIDVTDHTLRLSAVLEPNAIGSIHAFLAV